jgi:molybdopterin converting factor small subunit
MDHTASGTEAEASAAANVVVLIPSGLRRFTGQAGSVELQAHTVGQALRSIAERFPLLRTQMYAGDHELRRFINVFVNSSDIRFLQREHTPLRNADVITILPAIAGG